MTFKLPFSHKAEIQFNRCCGFQEGCNFTPYLIKFNSGLSQKEWSCSLPHHSREFQQLENPIRQLIQEKPLKVYLWISSHLESSLPLDYKVAQSDRIARRLTSVPDHSTARPLLFPQVPSAFLAMAQLWSFTVEQIRESFQHKIFMWGFRSLISSAVQIEILPHKQLYQLNGRLAQEWKWSRFLKPNVLCYWKSSCL